MFTALGKAPAGEEKKKTHHSPQYRDGQFQNPVPTTMFAKEHSFIKTMFKFFNKPKSCWPAKPLLSVKTDLKKINNKKPVIVWFGHSSYLIFVENKTILVDPVFNDHASPFKNTNKAFAGSNVYWAEDMPHIDVLLITHDHYDHLDLQTIMNLKSKVGHVITSLGVASHLTYWNYPPEKITELDWHQSTKSNELQFTAVPARHFSGRTLQRNQTLWSAFVLQTKEYKFFIGGDSGYASHFKETGEKWGPFDMAILECGQYNEAWHDIHMMPEETAKAALDLKANVCMPVHWGKFCLSVHPWKEPVNRFVKAAQNLHLTYTTPRIGEPIVIGEEYPATEWWKEEL